MIVLLYLAALRALNLPRLRAWLRLPSAERASAPDYGAARDLVPC